VRSSLGRRAAFAAQVQPLLPGVSIAAITGMAALFLSSHYQAPAMLFALLLGIALSFLHEETACTAGIEFTAGFILRLGVALLGLRIGFEQLVTLGWHSVLVILASIAATLAFGIATAGALGLQRRFGVLTGGSVAICGASAAMAIAAVMPQSPNKERDTVLTIVGVTSLSTIAMVLYPILAQRLGLTEPESSLFLGATIHDVAQVVGAGYSVSQQTGDLATLTKLVRVSFLMPVVLVVVLAFRLRGARGDAAGAAPGLPWFLVLFMALMVLNSLAELPPALVHAASNVSAFALVVAIAAIGMKSNLAQLTRVGFKPIVLMVAETLWLAALILAAIAWA